MKKKIFFIAASASLMLASCSSEDVVELNNGNAIDFRVAMGSEAQSRGSETTTGNIGQFLVTALNGNSTYFSNVLFQKNGENGPYESSPEYLWPGNDNLSFYAYSYYTGTTGDAMKPIDETKIGTVAISGAAQTITGFTPQAEFADQIDLVTAYNTGNKQTSENAGVKLTFGHALSQIQIQAFTNSEVYTFDVTGVKIASVNSTGNLNFHNGTNVWSFDEIPAKRDYSQEYADAAITLTATPQDILNGNAILVPQKLTKWDNIDDATNTKKGAYLAVKLRIKTSTMQVYPALTDEEIAANTDKFAWACVPVDTEWLPGNKYVYTLNFSNGAGQVPPEDPDEPGIDILGGPIFFTTEVLKWTNTTVPEVSMVGNNPAAASGE